MLRVFAVLLDFWDASVPSATSNIESMARA